MTDDLHKFDYMEFNKINIPIINTFYKQYRNKQSIEVQNKLKLIAEKLLDDINEIQL